MADETLKTDTATNLQQDSINVETKSESEEAGREVCNKILQEEETDEDTGAFTPKGSAQHKESGPHLDDRKAVDEATDDAPANAEGKASISSCVPFVELEGGLVEHYSASEISKNGHIGDFVSCYKAGNILSTKADNLDLSRNITPQSAPQRICQILARFFYPVYLLLAIKYLSRKTALTIDNLALAYVPLFQWPQYSGQDHDNELTINHLTIVCTPEHYNAQYTSEIKDILEKMSITYTTVDMKVLHVPLDSLSPVKDFISLFDDLSNISEVSSQSSQAFEYNSPHIMFGSCNKMHHKIYPFHRQHNQHQEVYKALKGNGILIATLGYGYNPNIFLAEGKELPVIDSWSFDPENAPAENDKEDYTIHWHIHEYTKTSKFVICRTTDEYGIIADSVKCPRDDGENGDDSIGSATAEAIKWLRKRWDQKLGIWTDENGEKKPYDNLIVLIPYGGQYMEDEMIEITKATDEGIIIVCAAGDCGDDTPAFFIPRAQTGGFEFIDQEMGKGPVVAGEVVFPAALGMVLSVGVTEIGPIGREIDLSMSFSPTTNKALRYNCGIAAAEVTGLLSLLLSHINKALQEPPDDDCKEVVRLIKAKDKYLHTCVIRELLVNEGNGSHDPQMGYGNGEEIIRKLLHMEPSTILLKLANVLIKEHKESCQNPQLLSKEYTQKVLTLEPTSGLIEGYRFTVAIIDTFTFKTTETRKGLNQTTFTEFKALHTPTHGEKCAAILKNICPGVTIQCAHVPTCTRMAHAFEDCSIDDNPASPLCIDVISCSISFPSFDYKVCAAVNKAVMAGKIIVFAAGNTGLRQRNTIGYPGRIGNIIVIGGRDQFHNRAEFSSVGREMDFLAEAEQFGGFGTSFAAPVVAGYIIRILDFVSVEMTEMPIEAWTRYNSDNPDNPHREYKWRKMPALEAAHNVFAMRALLKLLVPKPQNHSEKEGFSCLDLTILFPSYFKQNDKVKGFITNEAKKLIYNTLQHFYRHDAQLIP